VGCDSAKDVPPVLRANTEKANSGNATVSFRSSSKQRFQRISADDFASRERGISDALVGDRKQMSEIANSTILSMLMPGIGCNTTTVSNRIRLLTF
jgi:hypothetical protein